MSQSVDQFKALRSHLASRLHAALADVPPAVAGCAVGRTIQADVLVELAAGLLRDELGDAMTHKLLSDMAGRSLAVRS